MTKKNGELSAEGAEVVVARAAPTITGPLNTGSLSTLVVRAMEAAIRERHHNLPVAVHLPADLDFCPRPYFLVNPDV